MIELDKEPLEFFVTSILELAVDCLEKRVCAINRIPSYQQFLKFKVHREIVFDIKVKDFFTIIENFKASNSKKLVNMELDACC